jgi:nucleoside-diphosphate-sugar epimerase
VLAPTDIDNAEVENVGDSVNGVRPMIIQQEDLILVTGATGFIGVKVVESLLKRGFNNIRCFARSSSNTTALEALALTHRTTRLQVVRGNLVSREDCDAATKDVTVIFHLAASTTVDSFPESFLNSVVPTRNLLEGTLLHHCLRRFVNISSFSVYTNTEKPRPNVLDETCPIEMHPELRGDPYCFAKTKQDEVLMQYCQKFGIPNVVVRPGYVYGPGNQRIAGRVGIGTFGVFLHLGGSNHIPFTYVDNCAEAIVLCGITEGIDGEVFNVVDDDLPTSGQFLRKYKRQVRRFKSIYLPHAVSYALCYMWEHYSHWSDGQLPPAFNRRLWHAMWKNTYYDNSKLKERVGWVPAITIDEGLTRCFRSYQG